MPTLGEILSSDQFKSRGLDDRLSVIDSYWEEVKKARPDQAMKADLLKGLSMRGHDSGYRAAYSPDGPVRNFHKENFGRVDSIYKMAQEAGPDSPEFASSLKSYGEFLKSSFDQFAEAQKNEDQMLQAAEQILNLREEGGKKPLLEQKVSEVAARIFAPGVFRESEKVTSEIAKGEPMRLLREAAGRSGIDFKEGDEEKLVNKIKTRRGEFKEPFRVEEDGSLFASGEAFLLPKQEAFELAEKSGATRLEVEDFKRGFEARRSAYVKPMIDMHDVFGRRSDLERPGKGSIEEQAAEMIRTVRGKNFENALAQGLDELGMFINSIPLLGKFTSKIADPEELSKKQRLFDLLSQYREDKYDYDFMTSAKRAVGGALPSLPPSALGARAGLLVGRAFGLSGKKLVASQVIGSAVLPSAQSATETHAQAREQGKDELSSLRLAATSFLSEFLPTIALGRTGKEAFLVREGTEEARDSFIKRLVKEPAYEGLEEFLAFTADSFWNQQELNPDATVEEWIQGAVDSTVAGAALGLTGVLPRGREVPPDPGKETAEAADRARKAGMPETASQLESLPESPVKPPKGEEAAPTLPEAQKPSELTTEAATALPSETTRTTAQPPGPPAAEGALPASSEDQASLEQEALNAAREWEKLHRHHRSDSWFEGARVDADARRGYREALENGGANLQAHGMAKEITLKGAIENLANLLRNGLDPRRGGGRLHTAPLVNKPGEGLQGATTSGSAYAEGPFTLVAKPGQKLEGDLSGLGAVVINQTHAAQAEAIKKAFQAIRPDVLVGTASELGSMVSQLNSKKASDATTRTTAQPPGPPAAEGALPAVTPQPPVPGGEGEAQAGPQGGEGRGEAEAVRGMQEGAQVASEEAPVEETAATRPPVNEAEKRYQELYRQYGDLPISEMSLDDLRKRMRVKRQEAAGFREWVRFNSLEPGASLPASPIEGIRQTAQQGLEAAPERTPQRMEERGSTRITSYDAGDVLTDFGIQAEPGPAGEKAPPEPTPVKSLRVDEDGTVTVGKRVFSGKKEITEEAFNKAMRNAKVSNAWLEHIKQQNPGLVEEGVEKSPFAQDQDYQEGFQRGVEEAKLRPDNPALVNAQSRTTEETQEALDEIGRGFLGIPEGPARRDISFQLRNKFGSDSKSGLLHSEGYIAGFKSITEPSPEKTGKRTINKDILREASRQAAERPPAPQPAQETAREAAERISDVPFESIQPTPQPSESQTQQEAQAATQAPAQAPTQGEVEAPGGIPPQRQGEPAVGEAEGEIEEGAAQREGEGEAVPEEEAEAAEVAPPIPPRSQAPSPLSAVADPDTAPEAKSGMEELADAANDLPADERHAVLSALSGRSVKEIAEDMGKTAEEIRRLLDIGGRMVKGSVGPEARGLLMVTEAGVTSTMNEVMRAEREARGAPPILRQATQSHPEVMAMADDLIQSDPGIAQRLVEELASGRKDTISTVEEAILLIEKVNIMNRRREAEDVLIRTNSSGQAVLDAQEELNALEGRMNRMDQATAASGRIWGRTGRFRQNFIDADRLSLMDMERALRAAKGETLTRDEQARLREMADEITRLSEELNLANEGAVQRDGDKVFDQEMARMVKDYEQIDPAIVRIAEKIAQRIERAAEAAEARIREKMGRANVGIDPTILWDLSIVGAKYIARGAADFTRWSAEMVERFKDVFSREELEPHLQEIYEGSVEIEEGNYEKISKPRRKKVKKAVSGEEAAEVENKIRERIQERIQEGDELGSLRMLVHQLALNLVRSGVRGRDNLLNRVHDILSAEFPGLEKSRTRDLISGYGDYKPLDPDEHKALLRRYKGELQQLAKLEELEAALKEGRPADLKLTGIQRRELEQEERKLQKKVNEMKKRLSNRLVSLGILEDPSGNQLSSSLKSAKTRAENEIKDLLDAIHTETRIVNGKLELIPDERLSTLRKRLEVVRKAYKEAFPDGPVSEEEQIRRLEKYYDNRIKTLEGELKEGQIWPKPRGRTTTSPEIELKKARIAELNAERDMLRLLDTEAQEAKREADLEKRIAKAKEPVKEKVLRPTVNTERVAELEAELKAIQDANKTDPTRVNKRREDQLRKAIEREKNPPEIVVGAPVIPDSPEVTKLRRELEDLRASRAEARRLAQWKVRAARRMADMEAKMLSGDVLPKKRTPLALDEEARGIERQVNEVKKEFLHMRHRAVLANRTLPTKIRQETLHVLNTARAVMTSFDLSATGRQGILLGIAHPVHAANAFLSSIKSFGSDKFYKDSFKRLQERRNFPLYQEAKLFLVDPEEYTLSKMEEAYMTRLISLLSKRSLKSLWAPIIAGAKGVEASQRAYVTFLNELRANVFDTLAGSVGLTGTGMNAEGSQVLANFINIATGRGDLAGAGGDAAVSLNALFFSPRLVVSRFQYLLGIPIMRAWGVDRKAAKAGDFSYEESLTRAISLEYVRTLTGLATITVLGAMAGAEIEDEPTSSDFLKMTFGNTRVDFFGGLLQATVLVSRIAKGETTTISGEKRALRGPDRKFGGDDTYDVIARFFRSKFNPSLGAFINVLSGENAIGEEATPAREGIGMFTPMVLSDIMDAAEEYGWTEATLAGLLAIMGIGVQTFDPERANFERDMERKERAARKRFKELGL